MRVCYFGTYREEYSRNQIMIAGLRSAGVEVTEVHVRLWSSIQDRINAVLGGWRRPKFWLRVLITYMRLLYKFKSIPDFDILIVGYPGQFDVYIAKLISVMRKKPLVWDVFMSIYLISQERSLDRDYPFSIRMLSKIERNALGLADLLIQDTSQYVNWFIQNYQLSADRFVLVPTGADDRIFHPITIILDKDEDKPEVDQACRVIYYGTFIPNHSVITIIEAAQRLRNQEIIFTLIGDGPDKPEAQRLVTQYGLTNVRFLDWMDQKDLIRFIEQADIFLGAFGETPQSIMTVQNKIFEGMAMRKPVITGTSEVVRGYFTHGQSIFLCERQDAESLAEAIQTLAMDQPLRTRIADNGYKIFREQFTVKALGEKYRSHLENLLSSRR